MTITPATAKNALGALRAHETPERAAYDCRLSLRSIAPYTDRELSRTIAVLDYLAARPSSRDRLLAQLSAIAGEVTQ